MLNNRHSIYPVAYGIWEDVCPGTSRLPVPGGWIYEMADNVGGSSSVFVPFPPAPESKSEIRDLRFALTEIERSHVGDCPASLGDVSDVEWARRCHSLLRSIARDALRDAGNE